MDGWAEAVTPTLLGRIQTRLLLLVVVGVPLTLLVATLLNGVTLPDGLMTLAIMAVVGVAWELLYHLLQQLRWDKDWPSIAALAAGVPESLVTWQVLAALDVKPGATWAFGLHFGLVWVAAWLVAQGPMRVLAPQWRFHGMQFVRPAVPVAPKPERARSGSRLAALKPIPQWVLVAGVFAVVAGLVATWITTQGPDRPSPAAATDIAAHDTTLPDGEGIDDKNMTKEMTKDKTGKTKESKKKDTGSQVVRNWDTTKRSEPTGLAVPAMGQLGQLTPIGLKPNGTLETPPASSAGWYQQGVAPGQRGPAIVVGDMSTGGVFSDVLNVADDSRIGVTRSDGMLVWFEVDRVQRVSFANFPTAQVYADTQRPTLRMIGFDSEAAENVIVFATATSVQVPTDTGR